MKELLLKLKCHTPWCKYEYSQYSQLSFDELEQKVLNDAHIFQCDNICVIKFDNWGNIAISFYTEKTLDEIRELSAILLYFISICNGFNCEYEPTAIIDNIEYKDFFTFAPEDKTLLPLLKNEKFYDISLEEIRDVFGNILSTLFAMDKRQYYLSLLSNYYALLVYKDFVGNGEYRFRNIVTDLESLITLIYYENKYKTVEEQNEIYFDQAREHLSNQKCKQCPNINEQHKFSKTKTDNSIMPKKVSLETKLKDVFDYAKKFGLLFKLHISNECKRIAYTRNFISHLFSPNNNVLSEKELSSYIAVFGILFRMIFLSKCGIDNDLIKKNFLQNKPIRQTLSEIFDIN